MDDFILTLIVIFIIAGLAFIVDVTVTRKTVQEGVVMSHQFSAGKTYIGNGINSDGNVTVNVSSSSDEYILILHSEGEYVQVNTDINFFSVVKDSANIEFYRHSGCITGWTYRYSR